jgi:hypothetical protein
MDIPWVSGGKQGSYSLQVRMKLAKHALELKQQWEAERDQAPKEYDLKTKRWRRKEPKWGYITRTLDENIPSLRGKPHEVISNLCYSTIIDDMRKQKCSCIFKSVSVTHFYRPYF